MNDHAVPVDIDRLMSELRELATFSSGSEPPPAVTRVVYSPPDVQARDFFESRCREAGLRFRVDPIGNMFATWVGSDPSLPAVATGSHIDAIPHSGMYDGTVGVLGGLEAIRSLGASGFEPKRNIEVVLITSEEPTRFGIGCLGSRALSGNLDASDLRKLVDAKEVLFDQARTCAGFAGDLESVRQPAGVYSAWVELHIEQGPVLERSDIDIGVVSAIAAPATLTVRVEGQGGHAGGVLMPDRHDALAAAAEVILAIEQAAKGHSSDDLVATVGTLDIHPSAVNSIPAKVTFSIDIRDVRQSDRDAAIETIRSSASAIADTRGVVIKVETLHADPPAACDANVRAAITRAAENAGLSHHTMVSRAYHDSLFMSSIAPMGMIFIPCRGGVSHRPDEYSSPEQICRGVTVLAATLAELANQT